MSVSIHQAIYQYLITVTELHDLVADKIYPSGSVPSSSDTPYISYFRVSETHNQHQGGDANLALARIQFDIWADTRIEVENIYQVLRPAFNAYRGPMGASGQTIEVKNTILDNNTDTYEIASEGRQTEYYKQSVDFFVWYVE